MTLYDSGVWSDHVIYDSAKTTMPIKRYNGTKFKYIFFVSYVTIPTEKKISLSRVLSLSFPIF